MLTQTQRDLLSAFTDVVGKAKDASTADSNKYKPFQVLATLAAAALALDGGDTKNSVRAVTTGALPAHTPTGNFLNANANGDLNDVGIGAVVTLAVGDRVLVNHGTAARRGIYTVESLGGASAAWQLARAFDGDADGDLTCGSKVYCEEGTDAGKSYVLTTANPITINVTSQTWTQTSEEVTEAAVLAALALTAAAKDMGGGAVTNVGLVDGRDVSADGTALDAAVAAIGAAVSTSGGGAGNAGKLLELDGDGKIHGVEMDQVSICKGIPAQGYLALDDGAGNATQPTAADTFRIQLGALDLTFVWVANGQPEDTDLKVEIGADAAASATRLALRINAHPTGSLAVTAFADLGVTQYVNLRAEAAADIEAGNGFTFTAAGATPGVAIDFGIEQPQGRYMRSLTRYVVDAQDDLKDSITLDLGFTSLKAVSVRVETSATDSRAVAWNGATSIVGGVKVKVDNSSTTDWAAGHVLVIDAWGTI